MSRKRHRLVPETLGLKRPRERRDVEADPLRGESGSARAAVAELVRLFPRVLFEDALPPIVLRNQVYSLVPDRTVADRQLRNAPRKTSQVKSSWSSRHGSAETNLTSIHEDAEGTSRAGGDQNHPARLRLGRTRNYLHRGLQDQSPQGLRGPPLCWHSAEVPGFGASSLWRP
uniref:Serine/threonine kinase 19 n=1 Tax=Sus scrofa TaxID=9823 RepID=A0ABB5US18_PIG